MNKKYLFVVITILLVGLFLITFAGGYHFGFNKHKPNMWSGVNSHFMKGGHDYGCCLTNTCSYCLTDSKHNGVCDCFEEVVNGEKPCNQCVKGILEGTGNKYLAKYFAKSINEKGDERSLMTLKEIIEKKYNVPVLEQY